MSNIPLCQFGPGGDFVTTWPASTQALPQVPAESIARPARVHFVTLLPKTRSGKLLRRSIQALAEGRDPGDLTTIEDPAALEQIRSAIASKA